MGGEMLLIINKKTISIKFNGNIFLYMNVLQPLSKDFPSVLEHLYLL